MSDEFMDTRKDFSNSVCHIYEASWQPDHWPAALEAGCKLTGDRSGGIFIHDKKDGLVNSWHPFTGKKLYNTVLGRMAPAFKLMANGMWDQDCIGIRLVLDSMMKH